MKPDSLFPAAILAGGLATRLRPLTESIPKAMVEVAGRPFIGRQLELLRTRCIRRVVLCTGHLGEVIHRYVGDGSRFGLRVQYSSDGRRLLGTAGAVRRALPLLGEAFFVIYGDSYLPCDYAAIQAAFEHSARPALMTVYRNQGRWDQSNVCFRDGKILRYDKRHPDPQMEYIDYGLGVFRAEVFRTLPPDQPADLADVYAGLLASGQLAAYEVRERFYEIGSFGGLQEFSALCSQGVVA